MAIIMLFSHGILATFLFVFGVVLLNLGWFILLEDRKRGQYWLDHHEANPKFTVFSFGVLLFPLGLLVLTWGICIP